MEELEAELAALRTRAEQAAAENTKLEETLLVCVAGREGCSDGSAPSHAARLLLVLCQADLDACLHPCRAAGHARQVPAAAGRL